MHNTLENYLTTNVKTNVFNNYINVKSSVALLNK